MSINNDFDVEEIRVTSSSELPKSPETTRRKKPQNWIYQPKLGERFIRGPLPFAWFQRAGKGKGKAVHVAIALWLHASLNKSAKFSFNQSRLAEMGVTRDSARRGLRELERLKLVKAERHDGRKPIVTILIALPRKSRRSESKYNGNGKESSMLGAN